MPHTRLRYHIVTATKYRCPLITPEIEGVVHHAVRTKASDLRCRVISMGNTKDHIHVVAAIRSSITVADFIRAIKSSSSLAVKKSELDPIFDWQRDYSALTLDSEKLEGIIRYVINQKWHHFNNKVWDRYEIIG